MFDKWECIHAPSVHRYSHGMPPNCCLSHLRRCGHDNKPSIWVPSSDWTLPDTTSQSAKRWCSQPTLFTCWREDSQHQCWSVRVCRVWEATPSSRGDLRANEAWSVSQGRGQYHLYSWQCLLYFSWWLDLYTPDAFFKQKVLSFSQNFGFGNRVVCQCVLITKVVDMDTHLVYSPSFQLSKFP